MYVASMNTRRSSVGVGVVDGKNDLCVSYLLCHQNENPSFKYVYAVFNRFVFICR